jgi:VCBS repeat-containing protein
MATFTVTSNSDAGLGSLREAITQANALAGADTIVFDGTLFTGGAANLIRLTSGEIAITDAVTINAAAAGGVTITGDANNNDITLAGTDITDVAASGAALLADNSRIFLIGDPFIVLETDTTLQSLTLTGGRSAIGGAVYAHGTGALTLLDSTVSGNSTVGNAGYGGGIAGFFLTLTNSTVSGNATEGDDALGGGAFVYGNDGDFITLTNSTVSGNFMTGDRSAGGGIAGTDITLINSTVSGNSVAGAGAGGGGIVEIGITGASGVTLINSTVSGNSVAGDDVFGGGIVAINAVTLTNSTVSGNSATGSNAHSGGIAGDTTVTLTNAIVLGNVSPLTNEISGTIVANGLNIVGTGGDSDPVDHIINGDPTLVFEHTVANGAATAGMLADNGGPVHTIALKLDAANPALDAGNDGLAPAHDARGFSRANVAGVAHNGANISDLGAFELQNLPTFTVTNTNDAGAGSLRDAISQTNAAAGADTIAFDPTVFTGGAANLIRLTSGAIAITEEVTINGSVVGGVTITGDKNGNDIRVGATAITDVAASGAALLSDNSRIFIIASGADTTLQSLTLTGGRTAVLGAQGGAIYSESVALTLVDSTVSGNSTSGKSSDGGAIFSYGTTLTNSTVSGNSTTGDNASGGGLKGSDVTLINSTVSGNSVAGVGADGGGIQSSSTVTLTNSTVSGNSVTGSSAFGGGIDAAGTVTLTNAIVLGNDNAHDATDEINGTVVANGLNIVGTGGDTDPGDHRINADPTLVFAQTVANGAATAGVLANNGGPVQTIALKLDAANPALDAGDDSLAPAQDARGSSRADLAGVAHSGANISDLGAFELQGAGNHAPVAAADAFTLAEGGAAAVLTGGATSVVANDTDADSDPLTAVLVSGPAHGTLTLNPNGTFSYTHNGSETTSDSFTYKANDGTLDSAPVTVTITVTPINDAPVVSGPVTLSAIAKDSGARLITQAELLAHASDADGPSLTAVNLQIAAGAGSLVDNNDGTWSFTPAPADDTSVTFSYQVTDGTASVAASASVDLTSVVPGTSGNDSFDAPSGSSTFDAGLGVDTMTFGFKLTDATLTWSGSQVTVTHGADQTMLSGFERFVFTDGTVETNDADPLVDDLFYYAQNPDVWNAHADADAHFHQSGWHEGRDPNAFFSTSLYLQANPDVAAAGVDPLIHFHSFGWREGRVPSLDFDPKAYLVANPDVAAANFDPLAHFLQFGYQEGREGFEVEHLVAGNGFDYAFYLRENPDVAAAGVDPLWHFEVIGWKEGRDPNAWFDAAGYLDVYTDVAAAHVNPLDHYNQSGWREGRDPSTQFDTVGYLAANPDVAAAAVNPLLHYLQFGIHEGRSAINDGVWA